MSDKMLLVEVGRRTTIGPKLYGAGGKYEVDEDSAQVLVDRGGKVLKGKLDRKAPINTGADSDHDFMNRIRRNAREIVGILQAATSEDEYEEEETKEKEAESVEKDAIPEDFPGREILAKNEITKISQIPADKESLMKLNQMTGRVADQIGVKLSEIKK